jgi:hypothetical protein
MKPLKVVALAALATAAAVGAFASETAHFAPGLPSIRDFFVPEPGFYGIIYNWAYSSDRLNDRNGDEISVFTIPIPPDGLTLHVALDLDVYALSPGVMWCSNWKVLGAKYGAYSVLSLANTSIGAALTTQTGTGRSMEESQFNLGDWFIQPVWLGWTREHWDVALGYGFYAPIGKYDTEDVTFSNPITHEPLGTITAEAADNIGLGFWTHQFQGACGWYPWKDKRMAVAGTLTWEINGNKQDFDLTPGQNLALNWGVSEYLPLTKDKNVLLEVGPAGYNSWQITDDSGDDAVNPSVHDHVYGVGVQIGSIYVPWHVALNFRYIYEYAAADRFQGQSFGLNFAMGF